MTSGFETVPEARRRIFSLAVNRIVNRLAVRRGIGDCILLFTKVITWKYKPH